jgi:hypothetical protein
MEFKMVSGVAEDPNVGTLSANNKDTNGVDVNPSTSGRDAETVTTLVDHTTGDYISTAYIRNKPMISPWEIGFIHRAAQWETINIHEYNKYAEDTTNGGTLGGGCYTDADDADDKDPKGYNGGDANILDQIKTESLIQTPMKVSLACSDKTDIFYALVYNVQIGDDPKEFGMGYTPAGSRQIIDAGAVKVAQAIGDVGDSLSSRCELADISALKDGSCGLTQDNDAKQEELIGKIINLTSVATAEGGGGGTDHIQAVVLVQVIKDLGGYASLKAGGNPNTSADYVPQEVTIFRDIDGNGLIDDNKTKFKEAGFDLDGMNFTLKNLTSTTYDTLDGLSISVKSKLTESYTDPINKKITLDDFYANDKEIKGPISYDNSYEKIKATLGRYDLYTDRISYQMKALIELKKDSAGNYKVVHYELLGE